MAAQQSSQQAALQRDVDALIAQLRDLGVPYDFPAMANEVHSTKYRLAGHTKGNTKDQRKKMRRQTIRILEHTRDHLESTLRTATSAVPDAATGSADQLVTARGDAGRPDGTLLTVADVLAQTATGKESIPGADKSGGLAGNVRDAKVDASSSSSSSSELDTDDDGHHWMRDYVPSLGARSHTPDTAPARVGAGAGAKKSKKRSKLRQSGGKGF